MTSAGTVRMKPVTAFSVVTGTLALLLTYLPYKETAVVWYADSLPAFLPRAAVLLLPYWGYYYCPGKKHLLHLCASWLSPHAVHLNCDGTNLPNKHWICLVSGMSDSLSLLITIQKQI